MSKRGEVLVAIMNHALDFVIARDQHWYRIPVSSVQRFLKDRWPPEWLAFYQTKVFGEQAYALNYYARVTEIREVFRYELFPNEPKEGKWLNRYHQLILSPLQQLPQPIFSHRYRRIVFIPTSWDKFSNALEINDLFDESPLEDRLWAILKRNKIEAERQELVQVQERSYFLDFAIHCAKGQLDVETDGDTWHANPEQIPLDNLRDNDLETIVWRILRFNTHQVQEQIEDYCLPTIVDNVNRLGGLNGERTIPRKVNSDLRHGFEQMTLFDSTEENELDSTKEDEDET